MENLDSLNTSSTEENKTRMGITVFSDIPNIITIPTSNSTTFKDSIAKINNTEGSCNIQNALMSARV